LKNNFRESKKQYTFAPEMKTNTFHKVMNSNNAMMCCMMCCA